MAITADGSLVAASTSLPDGKGALLVWEATSDKVVRKEQMPQRMTALAFSPDGKLLAAGNKDGLITVWPLPEGKPVFQQQAGLTEIHCLEFTRDRGQGKTKPHDNKGVLGWLLASGDAAGGLLIWDLKTPAVRTTCQGSRHNVYATAFNADGTLLASGGRGRPIIWDVATGEPLFRFGNVHDRNHDEGFTTGLAFSQDGTKLAVSSRKGSSNGKVYVWELEYGRGIQTLRGLRSPVARVCFSLDGQWLAALTHDWHIGIWDRRSGQLSHVLDSPVGFWADNSALAFSPDGSQLACSSGTEARAWDVATGKQVESWPLPPGMVDQMGFHPSGKLLLFRAEMEDEKLPPFAEFLNDHRGVCRIWELPRGKPRQLIKEIGDFNRGVSWAAGPADAGYFVADGKSGKKERSIKAFDGATGKQLWSLPSERTLGGPSVQMDHTGKLVRLWTDDPSRSILREMPSGELLGTFDETISTRAGLTAGATHWDGLSLFRRGDKNPLLTLDPDGLVSSVLSATSCD
jgi:WD40 repeat protein